jgi:serine/threonine protein kinase
MLAADSTIAGRYRLASLIGEGGMASVWRAEDHTLKRSVAIKLLYVGGHRNAQLTVDHFLREARIAASIQHRNVIHIVDFGTTELGVPYMVMELLEGESLAARMEREPRLDMEEVVRLASLTLRGLAAVHDAGIVHRDLKPQNVFLQQDAEGLYPKILDFGISRSLAVSTERPSAVATQEGLVMGTPHYMAPEQARGEASIDKRADIYAMGAIIYEGITGRLPFDAETVGELLVKIISSQPPAMRAVRADVPQVLSDCVAQAMAPNRDHRFVDAKVFRRALQSAADSAFPPSANLRGSSEQPRGGRAAVRSAVVPPVVAAERALPPAVALDGIAPANNQLGTWGDFEGLAGTGDRASKPRPAPRVSAGPERVSQAAARAVATPPTATDPHDGVMLGDSPLDGFGSGLGPTRLDLDYGPDDSARGSRHSPAPKVARRASLPGRASLAGKRGTFAEQRKRPSALWIMPAMLLLVLCALLVAPGLFSAAPLDDAAALQRQAQSPATRASDRHLVRPRPANLAKMPPALRELAQ